MNVNTHLAQEVKKLLDVEIPTYKQFNGKRYRLMGIGKHKDMVGYKKKKGRSFRIIKIKTPKKGIWYVAYLYGKEF